MKKMVLCPLQLDKETIARLDARQLSDVIGGVNGATAGPGGSGCCSYGGATVCAPVSTGCTSGGSTCGVAKETCL